MNILFFGFALLASVFSRPLTVGISEQFHYAGGDGRNPLTSANFDYADSVQKAGHIPVILARCGDDTNRIARMMSSVDVLLMSGGHDVDPSRYGEARRPCCEGSNLARDAFDWQLMDAAVARGIPIVGICRGAQAVNVYFGGTLWQDIDTEHPTKRLRHRGDPLDAKVHEIAIAPDSRLAKAMGVTNCVVNSSHHQAVRKLAPGFRIVARSPDGIIEAIEGDKYPAIGVQFHPEAFASRLNDPVFIGFFRNILTAAGAK